MRHKAKKESTRTSCSEQTWPRCLFYYVKKLIVLRRSTEYFVCCRMPASSEDRPRIWRRACNSAEKWMKWSNISTRQMEVQVCTYNTVLVTLHTKPPTITSIQYSVLRTDLINILPYSALNKDRQPRSFCHREGKENGHFCIFPLTSS